MCTILRVYMGTNLLVQSMNQTLIYSTFQTQEKYGLEMSSIDVKVVGDNTEVKLTAKLHGKKPKIYECRFMQSTPTI